MSKRLALRKTTAQFVEEVSVKFEGKYDCSEVVYINAHIPVTLCCPKHGRFTKKPNTILNPKKDWACPQCGLDNKSKKLRKPLELFKQELYLKFGDRMRLVDESYYGDVQRFVCREHGEFITRGKELLVAAHPCPRCAPNSRKNTSHYIDLAKQVHGDKYDYSLTEYVDSSKKVRIICKEHGVFEQTMHSHLSGRGCSLCSRPIQDLESFVELASMLHEGRYSYERVIYKGCTEKVEIICKEHGPFWQSPHSHYNSACGCPACAINSFSSADEGWLYVFAADGIIKVGITKQHHKNRINNVRSSSGIDFKLVERFKAKGSVIKAAEAAVLKELREIYSNPPESFDGSTECFVTNDLPFILGRCQAAISGANND